MSNTVSEFGQNQWLVDELYERYKADPTSVDASWHEFFEKNPPKQKSSPSSAPSQKAPAPSAPTKEAAPKSASNGQKRTPAPERPKVTRPPMPKAAKQVYDPPAEEEEKQLRGAANAIVKNMNASRELPTATSVRAVPAKLMMDNRVVINNHLRRTRGGKISFTHLIGFAMVQALKAYPNMNNHYKEVDGKPHVVTPTGINLGLAIDMQTKGGRTLVVAAIKNCQDLDFRGFIDAYEDIVSRAREGKLGMDDFSGVTISLTNPGGIGTVHSVPRLTVGQGTILGVGAMEYPAEYQGTSEHTIAKNGIGKITTLTSTYDHRIIQGAESGEFLREIHRLLLDDEFYDDIFAALRIPYEAVRWRQDITDPRVDKDARVLQLIAAYRERGHLMADVNPLGMLTSQERRTHHPDLDVNSHELTLWDLDREFSVGGFVGRDRMKLRDVLSNLRSAYCRKVGIEYSHILENDQREWLQNRIEGVDDKPTVPEQKYILSKVNAAEAFETFLQTKYVGQKRFSLEGAESVIPMMDAVIDEAAEFALDEVVIGMPHRGRLNVLANIVGKPYSQIFTEFEGNMDPSSAQGSGDVKYHLGAEGTHYQMFGDNEIKVSLTANPSHLEAVNPVLEGIVRSKQDRLDPERQADYPIVPMLLHGDAAFAGQGVVAETLNIAGLPAYTVGGTVHIIVNNQIGFTTAPEAARSSQYCTDVAKMIGCPVFHVNGDDPEACVRVARLAMDFRQEFKKDVVIDLVCYRRRGHNEADDPSMTQPLLYEVIDSKTGVRQAYTEDLVGRGDITAKEADNALRDFQGQLERVFNEVRELEKHPVKASESILPAQPLPKRLVTAVDESVLQSIGDAFGELPEGFTIHPRVKPVYEARQKMAYNGNIDWAFGELLALGSLAMNGIDVRLIGQDTERGTFTQRHAVTTDRETGETYSPLQHLPGEGNGKFHVWNSALTEYAGVGFEYGYSVGNPDSVVMWEAQFGDFVNGAQTIIDEYITAGEAKWGQQSSLTLLLPHGHEGMGPDHTSGRMERFLQQCAEGSMTVAQPSTPANYFHLLRRHATDGVRRPQIIFTPKSMLRNKKAVSRIEDFTSGKFRSVINDPRFDTEQVGANSAELGDPSKVTTMLMVTGKLYYELDARRVKDGRDDIAIVRLEQIHPIPYRRLREALQSYPNLAEIRWVQEEPKNQGAWSFLALELPELIDDLPPFKRVSRRSMAATSTGLSKVHAIEQKELVEEAFA